MASSQRSTRKTAAQKSKKALLDCRIAKTIQVYNKLAKQYGDYTYSHILQYQLNEFSNYLSKGDNLLDIGCAVGRDVEYLSEDGFDITGIDLSLNLIKEAKKRVKIGKFKHMNMMKMSFKDVTFKGIWCHATLCHVPRENVVETLTEFKRVLKNNGIMYIGLRAGKGEGMISFSDTANLPRYFVFYSLEELREIIVKSGFKVLKAYSELENGQYTWLNVFAQKI